MTETNNPSERPNSKLTARKPKLAAEASSNRCRATAASPKSALEKATPRALKAALSQTASFTTVVNHQWLATAITMLYMISILMMTWLKSGSKVFLATKCFRIELVRWWWTMEKVSDWVRSWKRRLLRIKYEFFYFFMTSQYFCGKYCFMNWSPLFFCGII